VLLVHLEGIHGKEWGWVIGELLLSLSLCLSLSLLLEMRWLAIEEVCCEKMI